MTAAVWVGSGGDPHPMVPPRTRVKVTGANWPAQIWARFASAMLGETPVSDFPQPSKRAAAGVLPTTAIPSVVGMPVSVANDIVRQAGFATTLVERPDSQYPPGTVVGQSPDARTAVRAGTAITLFVASSAH